MRILIIDNNIDLDCWGSHHIRHCVTQVSNATVCTRRAPQDDLPSNPSQFDKVIVSGSATSALQDAPWISRLHEFIRATLNENRPFLGICYGHQSLVRALGSKDFVRTAAEAEFGWTEIEILESVPLLNGLKDRFYTFSSHFEEAHQLPPGLRRVARSSACEIQAVQLENRPVFGIQFHPEKDLAGAEVTLAQRKKKGIPKVLLHPERSRELYDPRIGETIFRNFVSL